MTIPTSSGLYSNNKTVINIHIDDDEYVIICKEDVTTTELLSLADEFKVFFACGDEED